MDPIDPFERGNLKPAEALLMAQESAHEYFQGELYQKNGEQRLEGITIERLGEATLELDEAEDENTSVIVYRDEEGTSLRVDALCIRRPILAADAPERLATVSFGLMPYSRPPGWALRHRFTDKPVGPLRSNRSLLLHARRRFAGHIQLHGCLAAEIRLTHRTFVRRWPTRYVDVSPVDLPHAAQRHRFRLTELPPANSRAESSYKQQGFRLKQCVFSAWSPKEQH
ncbi:hypothetical protein INH39_23535 [Massilia violaceinigra]|uniref:Uncharacterized protein n=1 Tax=Massilia violaceinigra TaxID=2045208 RepID=A0ABY4AJA8_9BURK|nr:hypothetical protein [Massilia violaceinigra]UOD33689.1 hypothetical protein INH39_23535 [Massilia violaceinigra]